MTINRRRNVVLILGMTIVGAACSAGASAPGWTYGPTLATASSAASSAAPTGPPGASAGGGGSAPSGAIVKITAKNIAFDQAQLTVPAGSPFSLAFDNQDSGVPHNVAIYTDASAGTAVFKGDIVTGPAQTTYNVPALKAGSYFFRCDVHPSQMTGTLVVQ